jgi:hypothetical protein
LHGNSLIKVILFKIFFAMKGNIISADQRYLNSKMVRDKCSLPFLINMAYLLCWWCQYPLWCSIGLCMCLKFYSILLHRFQKWLNMQHLLHSKRGGNVHFLKRFQSLKKEEETGAKSPAHCICYIFPWTLQSSVWNILYTSVIKQYMSSQQITFKQALLER